MSPSRTNFSTCALGNRVFIFGGEGGGMVAYSDIFELDYESDEPAWRLVASPRPCAASAAESFAAPRPHNVQFPDLGATVAARSRSAPRRCGRAGGGATRCVPWAAPACWSCSADAA